MKSWLHWPVDWLHLVFFAGQSALTIATWSRFDHAAAWLSFDVLAVAFLAVIARATRDQNIRRGALWRLFHGCIVIPLVFTQVGILIQAMDRHDFAPELNDADRALFLGNHPLEALERIATPWLTEVMQWAYTSYILLPVATIALVAWLGEGRFVARTFFCLLSVFYLSYIGYYVVPASGPNIHNNLGPPGPCSILPLPLCRFESSLPGVFATDALRAWMWKAELTKRDCFPSGHVAVAVACSIACWRLRRGIGIIALAIALGVILSTVYLRYHYVVDVLAGIVLAVLGMTVLGRWHRRREASL